MIKNFIRVLISNAWVLVIGLINGFIIPKILPINEYANYNMFTLYVSYISALHLGFPSGMFIKYGGKEYKSINRGQYKSELLIMYSILTFFTALGLTSSLFLKDKYLFYVSIAILPVCIIGSFNVLYQAWGMFKTFSRINMIIPSTILIFVGLSYFYWGTMNADILIIIYLAVYCLMGAIITFVQFRFIRGVKHNGILSIENWMIEKVGFSMMIGNYINVLFHSLDKMFVNIVFDRVDFAMYSFAMQMQVIMTLFITAISSPLYYKLSLNEKNTDLSSIKDLLILFGSFSGTAYFACSIIVTTFLPKYENSLNIISIYFAVFPVLAVINSLYINLYKVKKMMKLYLKVLIFVFILAFSLNFIGVLVFKNYLAIAASTTIVYYSWFAYSSKHFKEVIVTKIDVLYISIFLILFFTTTTIFDGFTGLIIFTILNTLAGFIFYKKSLSKILKLLLNLDRVN